MATSNNGENWYFRKKWDDFRRGDLKVELRFDGQRAVARLYDLGVPETVRMLTAQMPFAVPVVHVAWSGDMVMSAQPFDFGPTEAENAVRLPRVGDLTWDHKVGEICFTTALPKHVCRLERINWSCSARSRRVSKRSRNIAAHGVSKVSARSNSFVFNGIA
jgi:hypothetical protein